MLRPVTTEGRLLAQISDQLGELIDILRQEPTRATSSPATGEPEKKTPAKKATAKKTQTRKRVTGE